MAKVDDRCSVGTRAPETGCDKHPAGSRRAVTISFLLAILLLPLSAVVPQASAAKATLPPPITLASPSPAEHALMFGWSVGIDGEYVVVGAPGESPNGVDYAGSAYIFTTSGTYVATLSSPNPQAGGSFGWSVAISGGHIVVGAPDETPGAVDQAGNVYVFATDGTYITTLTSPNPELGGVFGTSVAMAGTQVVVGEPGCAWWVSCAGNAYTFTTSGRLTGTLTSPNPEPGGHFGFAVAIGGPSVVVGAPGESTDGLAAGNAYIFTKDTYTTLTSPRPASQGEFGSSVAIGGQHVVIGACGESPDGVSGAGSAYIFTKGEYATTLTSPNPRLGGRFGYSVAIDGPRILVGALREGYAGRGSAYTFKTDGTRTASLTSPHGLFGISVAISGPRAVVGAGGGGAGAAYIFPLE